MFMKFSILMNPCFSLLSSWPEGMSEIVEIAKEVAKVDGMALPGRDLAKSKPRVDSNDERAN